MKYILIVLLAISCSACGLFGGKKEGKYGPTIAQLKEREPVAIPEDFDPVPLVGLEDIEASYRAALDFAEDPDIEHKILIRLADIEMAKSEERQLTSQEQGEFFTQSIEFYEKLLVLNKKFAHEQATPTNERVLYQLSKAYALDGRLEESNAVLARLLVEHPESNYKSEAQFRRAELAFSKKEYAEAERLYSNVVAAGEASPFYLNAIYMQGWSQFKRTRYFDSITPFISLLDNVLKQNKTEDQLTKSEKNITRDTFRILGIVFSYLDGPETITEIYKEKGDRHYLHRLYRQLGELYLEKKRYRDSADTFRHYVKNFPTTDYAPLFSVKAIDVYNEGNFPSEILPSKEEYVNNYGINSEYWQVRSPEQRRNLIPYLRLYIEELSSYYHARAQALVAAKSEYQRIKASGTREQKNKLVKPDEAIPVYLKAAGLYNQYVRTFTNDAKNAQMTYLMGEAYFEARYYAESVDAYEAVAYDYVDKKLGPDAGFAAVAALTKLVDKNEGEEKAKWKNLRIESAINFADYYPYHPEVLPVLTRATQDVFVNNELEKAITLAQRIISWEPTPPTDTLKAVQLVLAHSQFDLGQYDKAELAYRNVLHILPANSNERAEIIERISASIFKSAELLIATNQKPEAIERLLSIQAVAPNSDIAINAQYDASVYLIELENWQQAENVLLQFKQRYPNNTLSKGIPQKLAFIYQESEQWGKAASVLSAMAANETDPELRRQSRYLSAQLFEKSGQTSEAIVQYRQYANTYSKPFGLATEARYKLVQLYEKTNQDGKRRFWLKKLITENSKAGSARTQRSIYLAALAESVFAEDAFIAFNKVKLNQPLKKSLKKKKAVLKKALNAYKKLSKYGVAEFATLSNFKIGEIYYNFSQDLLNAEKPKTLDELALEQYEILIEEQAYPFEEKAIDIHTSNAKRSWSGIYDQWVKQSFSSLAKLLPARFGKTETKLEVSDGLH